MCKLAFFCHELCFGACSTNELSAFARLELDVVNHGTYGDVRKRECVADDDVGIGAALDRVAYFEAVRCEDVALFSVCIV